MPVEVDSAKYTKDWVNNTRLYTREQSVNGAKNQRSSDHNQLPTVSRSVPALSTRSKQSVAMAKRSKLELELKHAKEKLQLDKEARELELEMTMRQKEIEERKKLQEIEARLAKAQLDEELEMDSDDVASNNSENQYGDSLDEQSRLPDSPNINTAVSVMPVDDQTNVVQLPPNEQSDQRQTYGSEHLPQVDVGGDQTPVVPQVNLLSQQRQLPPPFVPRAQLGLVSVYNQDHL